MAGRKPGGAGRSGPATISTAPVASPAEPGAAGRPPSAPRRSQARRSRAQRAGHHQHRAGRKPGSVRALQLVWPDERGHRPWCPEFDNGGVRQPVLGVHPDLAA
ncbi:hypothetical protein [Mycobacterium sp. P7213]|uniref:hypothetical protein n=1 Tax=Mycobacterium sp. P7213 TaxID=2478465 RepID=UPI0019D216EF|nr:hypothetical protein [Mycobacterium sp. P7213]